MPLAQSRRLVCRMTCCGALRATLSAMASMRCSCRHRCWRSCRRSLRRRCSCRFQGKRSCWRSSPPRPSSPRRPEVGRAGAGRGFIIGPGPSLIRAFGNYSGGELFHEDDNGDAYYKLIELAVEGALASAFRRSSKLMVACQSCCWCGVHLARRGDVDGPRELLAARLDSNNIGRWGKSDARIASSKLMVARSGRCTDFGNMPPHHCPASKRG